MSCLFFLDNFLIYLAVFFCMIFLIYTGRRQETEGLHVLSAAKKESLFRNISILTLYVYTYLNIYIQAGGKKLKGFMSSAKKESLFRTSENGRVGFTGSGKGMVIKNNITK